MRLLGQIDMSSKSDILYGYQGYHRIYEETSEPQYILSKFQGFNVHVLLSREIIKTMLIDGDYVSFTFYDNTEISETVKEMRIWFGYILNFDMDENDFCITIKGGTKAAKNFLQLNFY